ncbi:hypothetical protein CBM2633_A10278 [Cupriavidus taiwanensis]|nr:hypothetical protein CBM2633_A10278 [Cupriavidus taiwanensis]
MFWRAGCTHDRFRTQEDAARLGSGGGGGWRGSGEQPSVLRLKKAYFITMSGWLCGAKTELLSNGSMSNIF